LTSGVVYSFKVVTSNFNGDSVVSNTFKVKSCIAPRDVKAPALIQTTSTTVTLQWREPDNGGCPVTSYAVFSDLGSGTVNTNLDAAIENQPYLFTHTFTFDPALTGNLLRFKLQASNEIGATLSADYL
jgi:hypothetical protein